MNTQIEETKNEHKEIKSDGITETFLRQKQSPK